MKEKGRIAEIMPDRKKENKSSRVRKAYFSKNSGSPQDRILFLQRTIGNQAVNRLIKSGTLQAKLRIGQPSDIYEQEADRVADEVMKMPEPTAVSFGTTNIQRACPGCEKDELRRQQIEEEEEELQRQPIEEEEEELQKQPLEEEEEELQAKATSDHISEVNPNLESQIRSLEGGGQPLSENDRAFFEPWFGHDFSQVRVHADAQAAETAKGVNARAFTVGHDVVFGVGEYEVGTFEGRRLLAHELTHVVQQKNVDTIAFEERNILQKTGLMIHERAPLMVSPLLPLIVLGGVAILAGGLLSGCSRSEREETTRQIEDLTPDDRAFIEEGLRFFYRGQSMPRCINEQTVEVLRCLIERASFCSEYMDLVPRPTGRPSIGWLLSQAVKAAWRRIFRNRARYYQTCVTGAMAGCSREFQLARISCETESATTRGVR